MCLQLGLPIDSDKRKGGNKNEKRQKRHYTTNAMTLSRSIGLIYQLGIAPGPRGSGELAIGSPASSPPVMSRGPPSRQEPMPNQCPMGPITSANRAKRHLDTRVQQFHLHGYHELRVQADTSLLHHVCPPYSCDVLRFLGLAAFSSGGTNSFSRSRFFSSFLTLAFSARSCSATRALPSLDKKYSPVSICRSTLLFSGAGGKGVYDFLDLSVTLSGFFLLESVLLLKFGRYRLQSSLARAGSLASSRLILFSVRRGSECGCVVGETYINSLIR